MVAIALDCLWFLPEAVSWPVPPVALMWCFLAFLTTATVVFLIQKFVAKENTMEAVAKGFGMGVVVGVPFPVFGVLFGLVSLSGTGIRSLVRRGSDEQSTPKG